MKSLKKKRRSSIHDYDVHTLQSKFTQNIKKERKKIQTLSPTKQGVKSWMFLFKFEET